MGNGIQKKVEAHAPDITSRIFTLRGEKVVLDSDLALIYGVSTKALNQAIRRNADRFPKDFLFRLTSEEITTLNRPQFVTGSQKPGALRSQSATLKKTPNLRSQIVTSSLEHGGRRYLPYAFTEHGALQAANVLNSGRATAMSIYVIRAFVKMRQQQAAHQTILKHLAEIDRSLLTHDVALRDIYKKLHPLLLLPPLEPKHREIGFHVKPDESAKAKARAR